MRLVETKLVKINKNLQILSLGQQSEIIVKILNAIHLLESICNII